MQNNNSKTFFYDSSYTYCEYGEEGGSVLKHVMVVNITLVNCTVNDLNCSYGMMDFGYGIEKVCEGDAKKIILCL